MHIYILLYVHVTVLYYILASFQRINVNVTTDEFSVRVTKNYFKDWCLMNSQPTFLFLANLTHYSLVLLFYTPENIRKHLSFLMFSGGMEKQHWAVMH